ncbi:MAG: alpha/beta fold hydrolase [Candidatus Sumerlaeia bacterium]|nr:alpha/beta fold hydrolase [Candidatus Sumerlaeia bacterium]
MTPALRRALRAVLASEPFRPAPLLANPHLQTIAPALFRRVAAPPLRVEDLRLPDGDTVRLHHLAGLRGAPRAVLLHGLEGSVESHYAKGLLRQAARRGWHATLLEFRSCGGSPMPGAPRLYHSGETGDLAAVLAELRRREPDRRLVAVGVSMGGNVLAKLLGESGSDTPLAAAVAYSAPIDLTACGPALDRSLRGVYTRRFLESLVPKALAKAAELPHLLDADSIRGARSIVELDDRATAPLHGFADVWDYYHRSSSLRVLRGVRRPLLLLNAQDDPLIPGASLPWAPESRSRWVLPHFPRQGGHVGFVSAAPPGRWRLWGEGAAFRFLAAALAL